LFIKADKDWVKLLINKLKKILDRQEMQQKINDEALITKRPVDNKCGSCDVKLDHLSGTRSDYVKWNKLPADSSNLKISNMGKGYSRMINFMKKVEGGDSDDETTPVQK